MQTTIVVQTTVVTQTSTPATTLLAAPTTVPSTSSGSPNSWIWLLVAILVIGGTVAAILIARRRRKSRAEWTAATEGAVAEGRALVDQLRDTTAQNGEAEPALQRRLQQFDGALGTLEPDAPSEAQRNAVTDARAALAGLNAALASDLQLRIGPPAPTAEQLETSRAVLDQRTTDLDDSLDRLAPAPAPTS